MVVFTDISVITVQILDGFIAETLEELAQFLPLKDPITQNSRLSIDNQARRHTHTGLNCFEKGP